MAGIGKLFKKGKRPPEPPTKDYDRRSRSQDDDSDDGCYLDPTKVHPTLHPNTAVMPSYPPPRPQHSPKNSERRSNGNASTRASLSSEDQARPVKPPRRHGKGESSKQNAPADDYCDPWDAARVPPMRQQFSTSSTSSGGGEAYCDPLDVSPPPNPQPSGKDKLDDYCDPWDSRKVKPPVAKKPTGRDEYMDPWDAKNPQSRTTPKDSDDENYSEPYDAGKVTVLDEQAKRMSLRGMRLPSQGEQVQSPTTDTRPLDDYDSPWESKGLVRPPSLASTSLGEQNKEVDSRPSEDYDKPWEWMARKTQHMSMASPAIPKPQNTATPKQQNSSNPKPQPYAKPQSYYVKTQASPQIDSRPPDDYDAPWEYNKRTSQLVSMVTEQGAVDKASFPPKPPRTFDEEVVSTGFEVDPELPLVKQTWYHGPITRVEAERILKYEEDGSFLVRDSESSRQDYSLSFKNNNAFVHLKIAQSNGKYVLGQFSKPFDAVPGIIQHYSLNKLNIKGAEHKYLKTPVCPQHEYFVLEEKANS